MISTVVIEQDLSGNLQIRTKLPPLLALAVVTAAYHELLSLKIQADAKAGERRILLAGPDGVS